MMAGSHVVVGTAAWGWIVAERLGGSIVGHLDWRAFGVAAIASLLPDIDHPNSWMGRRLPFLSRPLAAIFGHRGLTHSLLAVALLLGLGFYGLGGWAAPLVVGYLSHIAADGLTPQGVPLLWPSRRRFSLPICTTGGMVEYIIVALFATSIFWRWHGIGAIWRAYGVHSLLR